MSATRSTGSRLCRFLARPSAGCVVWRSLSSRQLHRDRRGASAVMAALASYARSDLWIDTCSQGGAFGMFLWGVGRWPGDLCARPSV